LYPQKCGKAPQKCGVGGKKILYRDRIRELMKEKGISIKRIVMESGVSADTLNRIIFPDNPEKDSPHVSTLERICKVLGVELWELFYIGDKSLVILQAELTALNAERDTLLAENAILKTQVSDLQSKNDLLKDDIINTHKYYINKEIKS
jgi:transcriptional regulator with XRE-family HTH domain